jgi:signal transduction histidine kinase
VVFHDPALSRERDLLAAAVSAAWLALDHARLQAVVRAQLRDVRESRARLVAASDEARRRVERDLHDGAQQRLLAAGLALQMLHDRTTLAGPEARLLAEAEAELRDAMRELRELATGIHPAVLTEQGLYPALAVLAARCPITMHLRGQDPGALPAAVQAAVYFAVSEAVANAVKHAHTAECTVRLAVTASTLTVDVVDGGVGGADRTGHGLQGLADRLAVVDGTITIHSPKGVGTRIHMEVPCESS